jgi:hypothetical protein
VTPEERLARLDELKRHVLAILADPAITPDRKRRAENDLAEIAILHAKAITRAYGTPGDADPMTRARTREASPGDEAREADGLHRLRKGRDQCTARRRDGEECQAPAMPGTLVCRHHGGSAPQVLIKARHFQLQMALHDAALHYQEAKGTPGEFDALCTWSHAERVLKEYEAKLAALSELRAELRRRNAPGRPP